MANKIDIAIGLLVLMVLVAAVAPTALTGLFNTTAYTCANGLNATSGLCNNGQNTGVARWVVTSLGTLGAIAFIFLLFRAYKGK